MGLGEGGRGGGRTSHLEAHCFLAETKLDGLMKATARPPPPPSSSADLAALQQRYERLQAKYDTEVERHHKTKLQKGLGSFFVSNKN